VVNGGNCSFGDVNWVHYVHAAYRAETAGGPLRRLKQRIAHHVFRRDERQSLHRARLVLANSEVTRSDLVRELDLPPARAEVVYYGIDPEQFRPATSQEREERRRALGWPLDRPLVCFVGALGDRRKGFDTLFAAWQTLCAEASWDADLVVVGSGAELPAWRCRAAEGATAGRVHLLGFRSDVPDLLPLCDLLAAPTRYEAYGLGVHEALCCGLPALVTRSAGVAERYPASLAGLLIENPDDAAGLARQLLDWRRRLDDYRTTAEAFGHALRQHTWDRMAQTIVRIIGE
jgi:glycosyltransferase involved in cell wall biosynthesis